MKPLLLICLFILKIDINYMLEHENNILKRRRFKRLNINFINVIIKLAKKLSYIQSKFV